MPASDDSTPASLTIRLLRHSGSHSNVVNARQSWSRRFGLLLELTDGVRRGVGEASPLPGHSLESLEDAEADLRALTREPYSSTPPPPVDNNLGDDVLSWLEAHSKRLSTASARFALESALLDYWSQRLASPPWRLLVAQCPARELECSTVLDPLTDELLAQTQRALAAGIQTIKLKVGRDFTREVESIRRLRERWSPEKLRLRLDANQAWSVAEASAYLTPLEPFAIEWVEEPYEPPWPSSALLAHADPEAHQDGSPAVALALDESLLGIEPSPAWLQQRRDVRALVLKPMLLGGWARCLRWARCAQRSGHSVVVSHLFDGPVALAACTQLAFAIQSPGTAAGLGLHAGLDAWRSRAQAPSSVDTHKLSLPTAPGLGVSIAERLSVHAAARECPDSSALVLPKQTLTYGDLSASVTQVTQWLETQGAISSVRHTGRPLALVAEPCLSALVLLFTCIELGLTVLPLHPRWSRSERDAHIERLKPAFVVDEQLLQGLEAELERPSTALPTSRPDEADSMIDPERDLAWLLTSGSTGAPRAARLSRRAFLCAANASAQHLGWQADDRWLLSLPFAHVGGLSVLTRCLLARRTVVVDEKASPHQWAEQLARHGVTLLSLVPTQLARLLADPSFELPPSVRAVLVGGARASATLVAEAKARRMPILRTYGLTEACSQVATECDPSEARFATSRAPSIAQELNSDGYVGRVLDGLEVRVTDSGTIQLRGNQLFSGYAGDDSGLLPEPQLPEAVLAEASFSEGAAPENGPGGGWFQTSDWGKLDGTDLYVFGRQDHVIITGGENVAPEAVEAVLARHPAIAAVCVIGEADADWGQRIVAVVQLLEQISVSELDGWVRPLLASYERPRRWVVLRELPTLASGKIDRLRAGLLAASHDQHP